MRKLYATLVLLFCVAFYSNAQNLTGVPPATVTGPNEYRLTTETPIGAPGQSGGVWKATPVSLASPFTINAQMNFGRFGEGTPDPNNNGSTNGGIPTNTGADGMAFVMAPVQYVGVSGEGIGYKVFGGNSSFAAEFDTWQNASADQGGLNNDIVNDHMAFMRNGNNVHGGVNFTPVYDLGNIETNTWYPVTITWNPATPLTALTVNFNGTIMTTTLADVLASFGNNPNAMVQWGFTGGTYSGTNDQRVRVDFAPVVNCPTGVSVQSSALPALDGCHDANTIFLGYGPQCVTFTATATPTVAGNTYTWYATGNSTPLGTGNPFQFCPSAAGTYNVYVVVTNGTCAPVSSANSAVAITVIDIRCKNKGKDIPHKVNVCHKQNGVHGNGTIGDNAHTLCVDDDAVPAHLAHGDCLGICPGDQSARAAIGNNEITEENVVTQGGAAIYPNPSKGQVQVNLGRMNTRSEIMVVNARGAVVERRSAAGSLVSFDLKKYGTGVYLVKVINGDQIQTTKVIVQD